MSRPNLLLIMADQLAARWLPAYGDATAHAPALTALAGRGTVFEDASTPSPLCAPARASLLTGLLPSRTGVFDNAAELRAAQPTVTHVLRAAGYETALSGKMHFVGPDQLHGYEQRLTTDVYPADLDWTPDWRLALTEHLPWYHTMESVLTPGVTPASLQQDYDDEVCFKAERKLFDLARERSERPFFLTVSFTNPHDPWEVRAEHWGRIDRRAVPSPAVPAPAQDPHSRRLRAMMGADALAPSDEQVRAARHGYFAAIGFLDEKVGRVLAALEAAGLGEDTVVAFTADHGELLGEHGLWYKMSFREPSVRVPLIVAVPGSKPTRVAAPVSLLDLGPTLLGLAGVPPPPGLDGTSLVGCLGAGRGGHDGPVLGEYLAEGVQAPMVMVRRGPHKLVRCPGDPDQLFALDDDPDEEHDLAEDPEHVGVLEALGAEADARWDLGELERRVLASQAERRLVVDALGHGRYTPWDFVPSTDADTRYVRSRADLYELQRRARLDGPGPEG